jgi:hypothetical protein
MAEKKIKRGKRWYTQKQIDEINLPKFLNHNFKILEIYKKKRSPYSYVFQTSDIDRELEGEEWFIAVLKIKTKTQEIISESTIIHKNVEDWSDSFLRRGYEKVKTI